MNDEEYDGPDPERIILIEQCREKDAIIRSLTLELATAHARIASLERQLHATAEGQRATLDQVIRVTSERDSLAAALEKIRSASLAVVGASEAYGETESAHLWQEMANIAEAALWRAATSTSQGAAGMEEQP